MTRRATNSGGLVPSVLLVCATLILIGIPATAAVRDAILARSDNTSITGAPGTWAVHDGWVAVRTLGYPLAIGVLAMLLAWPAAWMIRAGGRRGAWAGAVSAVPIFLPSYLAFAGWRLVHAPGTWLGDRFALAEPWVQIAIDRVLAVIGLALWASPIAVLILATGLWRVPGSAIEQLRVDGASRFVRAWHIARMSRGPIVMSTLAVSLVMLGSAVPIHLAQIDTLAQRVWWQLQLFSTGRVWIDAWPLVVVAIVAATLATRRLCGQPSETDTTPVPAGKLASAGVTVVATLGVVAPLLLFALSLRSWSSLAGFWHDLGDAAANSAVTGMAVGLTTALLGAIVWWSASGTRAGRTTPLVPMLIGIMLAAGLLPGVLVGQAVSAAWSMPGLTDIGDWLDSFGGRVGLAHVARFGFLGVLAGYWLARLEPHDVRDVRAVDGVTGLRGWLRACVRGRATALLGVAVGAAALSFHEIESAVIVTQPGTPSLPQRLLDLLHYNRDEQLAAAALNLVTGGIVMALLAGWLLTSGWRGKR